MIRRRRQNYPVGYNKNTIYVPLFKPPRSGTCSACKRSIGKGIKKTNIHHWKYEYDVNTLRKKPALVLKNTSEFCWSCHQLANCFMNMFRLRKESLHFIVDVGLLMPEDMREKMDIVSEMWIEARRGKNRKKINDF